MAWISAALLYALQLKIDPANTAVAHGPMAVNIAGLAGAVCVIIAGWTTANPTVCGAGAAWILTLGICLVLNLGVGYDKFFLFIPAWFIAAIIYIIGSKMVQKN
jgi:MFS superfamily sulfate permease-like transporter